MLNLESGIYYTLNPIGTRIWQLIEEHGDLDKVREEMIAEYEVGEETRDRDLATLMRELVETAWWSPPRRPPPPPEAMSKLSTAMHLPGPQKRAVLRLLPAAAAVEIGLAMFSLPRLARLLGVRLQIDNPDHIQEQTAASDAELSPEELLEVRAAHLLFKNRREHGRCLRTSLLVGRRLRHRDPLLRIGILKSQGQVKAHAWIDIQGTTIGESQGYAPLRSAAGAK